LRALPGQRCLEGGVVGVHAKAQDVELALPQAEIAGDQGVDLDAGYDGHPRWNGSRGHDIAETGERVMVGQGKRRDPDRRRGPDEHRRVEHTVRPTRVRVQVDRRRAWRHNRVRDRRRVVPASPGRGWPGQPGSGRHVRPR
jgi:hypothetical protein